FIRHIFTSFILGLFGKQGFNTETYLVFRRETQKKGILLDIFLLPSFWAFSANRALIQKPT
ncbi:hypothetical protein D8Y30_26960, partial [Escherichia coli]